MHVITQVFSSSFEFGWKTLTAAGQSHRPLKQRYCKDTQKFKNKREWGIPVSLWSLEFRPNYERSEMHVMARLSLTAQQSKGGSQGFTHFWCWLQGISGGERQREEKASCSGGKAKQERAKSKEEQAPVSEVVLYETSWPECAISHSGEVAAWVLVTRGSEDPSRRKKQV